MNKSGKRIRGDHGPPMHKSNSYKESQYNNMGGGRGQ